MQLGYVIVISTSLVSVALSRTHHHRVFSLKLLWIMKLILEVPYLRGNWQAILRSLAKIVAFGALANNVLEDRRCPRPTETRHVRLHTPRSTCPHSQPCGLQRSPQCIEPCFAGIQVLENSDRTGSFHRFLEASRALPFCRLRRKAI